MKVGRNEKCPCKSGLKFKNCCKNEKNVIEKLVSEKLMYNFFIIYDKSKQREHNLSIHLYSSILSDIRAALWYCLHMPRHGFDLISTPDILFVDEDGIHRHNINIISSALNEPTVKLLLRYPPLIYISEASCLQETLEVNEQFPSLLGCVSIEDLSSTTLIEHWKVIRETVRSTFKDIEIKLLDVSPTLLEEHKRSALPNIFLSNQNSDTEQLMQLLESQNYSFRSRIHVTKKQLTIFKMFHQLGSSLQEVSNAEITRAINEAYVYTPSSLVITLPGGPVSRKSYGVHYRHFKISNEELSLINFLGVRRAISQQGVWLEGNVLPSEIFSKLVVLEQHFDDARRPNSKFIIRTLKKIGKMIAKSLNIENIGQYIQASSRLIAFTDFPIGLAILPGYSDPLCSMISISYRPLTPLTSAFKYSLSQINEYYIGHGSGFNVLIIECLSKLDDIRWISDLGWSLMRDQLKENKLITVYYEEADSINSLEEIINSYENIDFLIISAHGTYSKEGMAGLSVNNQFWMPKSSLRIPPVVILSACHVAVKGQGNYTISDAFLEAGAIAVLGTLIPVNVKENAMITQ